MNKIVPLLIIFLFFINCSSYKKDKLSQDTSVEFKRYSLSDPHQFIIECFKDHDVVFLGEPHKIKEHLNFLSSLVPFLYDNGIYNICYEFLPYDRQKEIDQLVTDNIYNEALACDLLRSQYYCWAYQEYLGVLKAIWNLNHSKVTNGKKKFRIIGLGNSTTWDQERNQKWQEKDWALCIKNEVLIRGEKALVYSGTHHAITKFQQPYAVNGKLGGLANRGRMGHYVYKEIGERCMTIWLHYLWPDVRNKLSVFPCNGKVDEIAKKINKPFAFFTSQSELGLLKDTISIYGKGYKDFKLKFVADGYIVLAPICESNYVTFYEDFTTNVSFYQTLQQIKYFNDSQVDNLTPKSLNDSLKKIFLEEKMKQFEKIKQSVKCN